MMSHSSPLIQQTPTANRLPTAYNITSLFRNPMNKIDFVCWRSHFMNVFKVHDLSHVLDKRRNQFWVQTMVQVQPTGSHPNSINYLTISAIHCVAVLHCTALKEAWTLFDHFLSPLCSIHIKALCTKIRATKKRTTFPWSTSLTYEPPLTP